MKKSGIRSILLGLSCISFLGSGFAFAKEEISVTNHIDTGVIDIELEEYQLSDDGTLVPWENGKLVLPGDKVSKIPRISNIGYDCYVRAKLDFSLEELENSYFDIGDNWVHGKDGYWYYTEVLESGAYTDIFQGISIPDDFSQEYEDGEIQLKIDVDAIQINNFIPDYSSEYPWGGVIIKECIHEGPYVINNLEVENPKSFEIQYDKESKKLIKNYNDFFLNFPTLFPGDVYTDTLELENTSKNPINLYFHTFSVESDLVKNVNLRIELIDGSKKDLIYDGSLHSVDLEEEILLTKIEGGSSQKLVYTIEVPKELDNQYTLLHERVRWMFSVEELVNNSGSGGKPVATGDFTNSNLALVTMLVSGFVILVLYKKSKEEEI